MQFDYSKISYLGTLEMYMYVCLISCTPVELKVCVPEDKKENLEILRMRRTIVLWTNFLIDVQGEHLTKRTRDLLNPKLWASYYIINGLDTRQLPLLTSCDKSLIFHS